MSEAIQSQMTPDMERQIDHLVDTAQYSYAEAAQKLGYEFEATAEQVMAGALSHRPDVDTTPRGIAHAMDEGYYNTQFGMSGFPDRRSEQAKTSAETGLNNLYAQMGWTRPSKAGVK